MKTLNQRKKESPAVSDEVFKKRIDLIKRALAEHGYVFDNGKSNDERIYFKIEAKNHYGECSFGLWQIRHETVKDFKEGFNHLKKKLLHK